MTIKVKPRVIITSAGALVLAVIGTVILQQGISHAATPPPTTLNDGIQDRLTGSYFRVELDSSQSDYGAFVLLIPHVGLIWGAKPSKVVQANADTYTVNYQGSGYIDPNAQLDSEFGVNYQASGQTENTTINLVGEVDPIHGGGTIEVIVNAKPYTLIDTGLPHTATAAVNAYLNDILTDNWPALYVMSDTSLKSSTTQAEFITDMQNGVASGGQVTDAHATGPTSYSTSSAGIGYAITPVSMSMLLNGNTSVQTGNLELILEGNQWHFLTLNSGP